MQARRCLEARSALLRGPSFSCRSTVAICAQTDASGSRKAPPPLFTPDFRLFSLQLSTSQRNREADLSVASAVIVRSTPPPPSPNFQVSSICACSSKHSGRKFGGKFWRSLRMEMFTKLSGSFTKQGQGWVVVWNCRQKWAVAFNPEKFTEHFRARPGPDLFAALMPRFRRLV